MAFKGVSLFIKRCYSIAVKTNNEGNEDNRKMSSYVYIQAQHLIKNKQTKNATIDRVPLLSFENAQRMCALACLSAYLPSSCVCVIKAQLVANSAVCEVMQAAWSTPLNVQVTQMTWIDDRYVFWRIHCRKEKASCVDQVISYSLIKHLQVL